MSGIFTTHLFDVVDICLYSVSFLFGLPLHSYIIWFIVKRTGSGIVSEFFFLSSSVCEISLCVKSLLMVFCHFLFFQFVMDSVLFLQGLAITGRPLFQCLICVERYLAVVHPVTFLKYKPLRYRLVCSAVALLTVLGLSVLSFFFFRSSNILFCTFFFLLPFLLFLSIQLFCCLAVLRALKQSGPGERAREREEKNHMKRRVFHLILIATVSMIITYVPYIVYGFFTLFSQNNMRILWSFSFGCFVLGGFVQPVLYLRRTGKLFCVSL
ncbi:somatostatin receptor type 4-like [Triplophysa dalaica]|uniref:somatostatin receptor type 4-like n=1 Tax=Triplophysa dalaica TaxID=1582913 RepID=UPI0024E03E8C|nr:somatostatin receptor type 4-like [Triplophysa dalaica]